jgi:hypothetical protein
LGVIKNRQGGIGHLLYARGHVLQLGIAVQEQQDRRRIHHNDSRRRIVEILVPAFAIHFEARPQPRERNGKVPLWDVLLQELDHGLDIAFGKICEMCAVYLDRRHIRHVLIPIDVQRRDYPKSPEVRCWIGLSLDRNSHARLQRYTIE